MDGSLNWLWRFLLTFLAFSWMPAAAGAAQIGLHPESTSARPIISISGELHEGDERTFASLAVPLEKAVVVFSSPGGHLMAGIEIGKTIRIKGFSTHIGSSELCASACGLGWLGGVTRTAHEYARIGFHAAYVSDGQQNKESGAANAVVGAYLNTIGISQSAIIYITSAPPDGMQWLPVRQAKIYGIDLEVVSWSIVSRPSQVSDRLPDSSGESLKRLKGYDVFGFDLASKPIKGLSINACDAACAANPSCKAYTYNVPNLACFLKKGGYRVVGNPNSIAGYKAILENQLFMSPITVLERMDFPGGDYQRIEGSDFDTCMETCEKETKCKAFTFTRRSAVCWLKSNASTPVRHRRAISGIKLSE